MKRLLGLLLRSLGCLQPYIRQVRSVEVHGNNCEVGALNNRRIRYFRPPPHHVFGTGMVVRDSGRIREPLPHTGHRRSRNTQQIAQRAQ